MSTVQAKDILSFLSSQRQKDTLRFITCGSVDDGKSTLIGRLLHESKCIFDDQLKALETDSKQFGTQSEKIDFALLVDGLQAEREQGITIDVAYRFFATDKRRYIVADTPGHEQYTRNMATGASTAHLAILLVDARKGLLTQTRRHSRIVSMMSIRHVLLAINKMDLVNFDPAVFKRIEDEYRSLALGQGFETIQAIPVSALDGDNILETSVRMPWYAGPTLLEYLDTVPALVPTTGNCNKFRMPVQWVNRLALDFRGFCGRVAEGTLCPGDTVRILPSLHTSVVREIIAWHDLRVVANSGDAVTVVLTDELDISRGDVIVSADHISEVADQFEARLLWMADKPLMPGRQYIMKIHCKEVTATVTEIKYLEDVNSGAHLAAKTISLNAIAVVNVSTNQPVVFEPYSLNRTMGGFILIDKLNYQTVGAGMIQFALRRSTNIHWQAVEVNRTSRATLIKQIPRCIWFTGLSGSGKSTIANILEKRLHSEGKFTYLLDGDNIRHGLNRDLGFSEADRVENIRRVAEVARLMIDAGLIVLVAFISPYASERKTARALFTDGEFIEVFVDTPLKECERRDVKGLYKKARSGNLKNFTGIDSPYEPPQTPEIHLRTAEISAVTCADTIAMMLD